MPTGSRANAQRRSESRSPSGEPRRIQVYLDSSDFSDLTDARKQTPQLKAVLDGLEVLADGGQVDFRFSIVHVCEAAPTQPDAAAAAERRAALMNRLCGSNALVTIEEVLAAERMKTQGFSALSQGRWHPPLDDLLPDSPLQDARMMLRNELKATGLDRAERRRRERAAFRKGGWSKQARQSIDTVMPSTIPGLFNLLPLTPDEMQALMSYLKGGSGRELAIKGCQRVLANPAWFMRRYAENPEKMKAIVEWLREGGPNFVTKMSAAVAQAQDLFASRSASNEEFEKAIANIEDDELRKHLLREHKSTQQALDSRIKNDKNRLEESVLRKLTGETKETGSTLTLDQVRDLYPGTAAMLATGMHATRRAMDQNNPRPLQDSDFGDAMHAVYAPYVDIYRTDAFMAEGIEKMLRMRGTNVVRNLLQLPEEIRAALARSSLSCPAP